ncbi:FAD-dependent oxidoreductase [Paenibacillus thermoaerophilus]|uniref:FAD-dependent oxidoreductase n=1 Tax=Paenibacillus thermoaerophilus TaxID=1215385 RepID=A0ABW2UY67_9BACL|nr:FAD-dependent oxidoreductase [Paenibacillus thermoaerophilus]TMV17779.1 FAD-dependent oxidoreductase [Paenibacillus thermoaerophilus]
MTNRKNLQADVVIIGGGTGGFAAALAAAQDGRTVIMTEETDWIGGQLTSQAVPPDEHPWIEQFGCTRTYRRFRDGVRDYYRRNFRLSESAPTGSDFNPGNAIVSRISHEPRTALAVLTEMLAPYVHSGRVKVLLHTRAVSAETAGDTVVSVTVRHVVNGEETVLTAPYFLDATEEGDLLPLAGVEYVTGAESKSDTGEPHALEGEANPYEMQAITWCFAIDHIEGEDHTIERPEQYDFWREYQADFWPDKQLSWAGLVPHTLEPVRYSLFPDGKSFSLWKYRRLIDRELFADSLFKSDITVVNWPANDYWLGPIIDVSPEERAKHLENARQLSLSLLYWMQTEAPRPDGGRGYPGLRLRGDVVGTEDGLAKSVYIRESRRIKAVFTVVEQHLNPECRPDGRAESYFDSVGIGCYRIDLHPSTALRTYIDVSSCPFEIPLGALLPIRVRNLLPACKNIGTTHITNGCYRLHPVEWNIGEAAGHLAAFCLDNGCTPHEVRENAELLRSFQDRLVQAGIELKWPRLHAV